MLTKLTKNTFTRLSFTALLASGSFLAHQTSQPAHRAPSSVSQTEFYNEIFESNGQVRPQYEKVWAHYQTLSAAQKKQYLAMTMKDFGEEYSLSLLPRLLTEDEYSTLQKGVDQRGRALNMFLQDHYSGQKSYLDKVIPAEVVQRLLRRSGEEAYDGLIDPKRIAFPYGPDIIRDAQGTWRVLEDNTGFIGGTGDLLKARQSIQKNMPEYKTAAVPLDDPKQYYKDVAERMRAKSKNGIPVVFMAGNYADDEYKRSMALYRKNGIKVVTLTTREKLVSADDGLYLESKKAGKVTREKVGYVTLYGEHAWFADDSPATRTKIMLSDLNWFSTKGNFSDANRNRIQAMVDDYMITGKIDEPKYFALMKDLNIMNNFDAKKNQRIPNMMSHYFKGAFEFDYSPGVEFVGDKEFTPYVEDLVRFYLNEEPILKNVPTQSFAKYVNGRPRLESALLKTVRENKDRYVIKKVNGRGGDGIWVGSKATSADWADAEKAVRADPASFQVQEFKHLSVMDDYIVDMRMIGSVDADGVYVSPTPWGRALPLSGNGKVNISDEGLEQALMIVRNPPNPCNGALRSLLH